MTNLNTITHMHKLLSLYDSEGGLRETKADVDQLRYVQRISENLRIRRGS